MDDATGADDVVSAIPAEPAEAQNTAEAPDADVTRQDAAAAQIAAPDAPVNDQADTPAGSAVEVATTADPAPSAPSAADAPVVTSGLPADTPESPGPAGSQPSTAASPDPSTTPAGPSVAAAAASSVEPATPAGDIRSATSATPAAEPPAAEIFVTNDQAEVDATEDEAGRRRAGRARTAVPDPVCAAAEELARAAAVEEAGDPAAVGEHLGVEAEGDRLVLHRFASLSPAYRGWVWAVVATRAPRVRKVTIDDVVLMPGDDALLAPLWVPWSQRLRPGDVGVGDLLPTAVDDPRLALRQADVEELVDTDAFVELGLGRPRVLSLLGREEASARWYAGEPGPDAHVAKVAPATCLTCGFHVRLAGALGRLFGVCANELAPDDARVTSIDHGCGAHSEALIAPSAHPERVVFDEDPSDLEPTDVELVGTAANGATGQEPPQAHPAVGRPEPYGHA